MGRGAEGLSAAAVPAAAALLVEHTTAYLQAVTLWPVESASGLGCSG